MTDHDEIQDLLEGFVDETLDRPTRRMVDDHLQDCRTCRAILDEVAPVDLGALGTHAVDERALRRSVRRAMRRTLLDAVLVLVALWLAGWLVMAALVQPLIVNRGGRAAAAAQATIDMAIMFNPGASVTDFSVDTAGWRRTYTAEAGIQVGSGVESIGRLATGIGPMGFGDAFPYLASTAGRGSLDSLTGLGDGTVATVQLWFEDRLSVDEAQTLAESPSTDTRVIWAGFAGDEDGDELYGYATCIDPDGGFDLQFLSATSASGSRSQSVFPPSIPTARSEVERALANLARHPEIARGLWDGAASAQAALDHIASHGEVAAVVVTGPTSELLRLIEVLGRPSGAVLAVDFYNWSTPVCGR